MSPVGLEPTISAGERPKTYYALDGAATGIGPTNYATNILCIYICEYVCVGVCVCVFYVPDNKIRVIVCCLINVQFCINVTLEVTPICAATFLHDLSLICFAIYNSRTTLTTRN
jgi:hypothetical protein